MSYCKERTLPVDQGFVHSVETGGAVDGPGIRFVVFLSGCPLRCTYCHNPDTRKKEMGTLRHAGEIVDEILRYKDFMAHTGGGVTVTGGEPLYQPEFTKIILQKCKENGIHTALDTSGFVGARVDMELLNATDLVLLDIKSFDPVIYQEITKHKLAPTLEFAKILAAQNKPMWVRCVLIPDLNDNLDTYAALADFLVELGNTQKVEILPFHKMGEHKWKDLGLDYKLTGTPVPTEEQVNNARNIFKMRGLVTD